MTDFGPPDLASSIAALGHRCEIPLTHDRLDECHHWWHEMARNYHEPKQFRWCLGAFLQAARSFTFRLQSEKSVFTDMGFYDEWVRRSKTSDVLKWVNTERVHLVHIGALEPSSSAELRCLFPEDDPRRDDGDDPPLVFEANPFVCTHALMRWADPIVGDEDHGHDVVRRWEVESLPGCEILDACAEVFGELDLLLKTAHASVGQSMQLMKADQRVERPAGRYPCMDDVDLHRIAHFEPRSSGGQIWTNEPSNLHG